MKRKILLFMLIVAAALSLSACSIRFNIGDKTTPNIEDAPKTISAEETLRIMLDCWNPYDEEVVMEYWGGIAKVKGFPNYDKFWIERLSHMEYEILDKRIGGDLAIFDVRIINYDMQAIVKGPAQKRSVGRGPSRV